MVSAGHFDFEGDSDALIVRGLIAVLHALYSGLGVAAVGQVSEATGEAVKIFVVKKSPALTEDMVLAHCREHLTAYKVPRELEFLNELPKSNVGKILRRELRQRQA